MKHERDSLRKKLSAMYGENLVEKLRAMYKDNLGERATAMYSFDQMESSSVEDADEKQADIYVYNVKQFIGMIFF